MIDTQITVPTEMLELAKQMFSAYKSESAANKYDLMVATYQPVEIALHLFGKMIEADRSELAEDEINEKFTLRYFDQVFEGNPESYWGVEVQGCVELIEHDGSIFIDVDNHAPHFFGVYLNGKEQMGMPCTDSIGDFNSYQKAIGYAKELADQYGWRIADHVVNQIAVTQ